MKIVAVIVWRIMSSTSMVDTWVNADGLQSRENRQKVKLILWSDKNLQAWICIWIHHNI